ncbi:uncharacterized protein Z519_08229 [Cladophialophora bantiana CBS 173.52]|uniref:Uncharacterized protein n=1 Tax=Cladophialophora bantiana (strain ATCC 10958 / CBS 173.52 / CDC B-1940 / NIH 8579) TaxID=1442370 RepID=A0A0D2HDD5_CLAB1|nr:uncharacterized protein Z519_08229 [Cladophialophora bantiana CBS 173.52]KIW91333.1 hypothetical protein Z519_08229 [Cladophialophora bantiana CBS 173.52]
MELLQLRDVSPEAYPRRLLGGECLTVSLLFGFSLIQYWTNATVFSPFPEALGQSMSEAGGGQARLVIVWKRADMGEVRFDAEHLAHFVYSMYLRMFEHDNLTALSFQTADRLSLLWFP